MPLLQIKICGITNAENYTDLLPLKIDYVGFIFHEKSPRKILPSDIPDIVNSSGSNLIYRPKKVGVFVNHSIDFILSALEVGKLDVIQIHGDEDNDFLFQLKKELKQQKFEGEIWRMIRVDGSTDFSNIPVEYLLLEKNLGENQYGGSGQMIDFEIMAKFLKKNKNNHKKYILAGGLNAERIESILSQWLQFFQRLPSVLDFNSGVEEAPGVKSTAKIIEVIERVNQIKKILVSKNLKIY